MARIRSIKPETWGDQKLARLSRDARLLYISLWNFADEQGRMVGDPRQVKGMCLPMDDDLTPVEVDLLLDELAKAGRVRRYLVDDEHFLFLPNLSKHQRLDTGQDSRYPGPPDDDSAPTPQNSGESPDKSGEASGESGEIQGDPGEVHPRARAYVAGSKEQVAGSRVETVVEQARPIDDVTAVFRAWQEATGKHRARIDDKRRRRIREALKHYPAADVIDAVQGWQYSPFHCGQNDTGTKHNGLDLLLRDAEHLERFRDLWRDGPPAVLGKHTTQTVQFAQQMAAMSPGEEVDTDGLEGMDRHRALAQRQLSRPEG